MLMMFSPIRCWWHGAKWYQSISSFWSVGYDIYCKSVYDKVSVDGMWLTWYQHISNLWTRIAILLNHNCKSVMLYKTSHAATFVMFYRQSVQFPALQQDAFSIYFRCFFRCSWMCIFHLVPTISIQTIVHTLIVVATEDCWHNTMA